MHTGLTGTPLALAASVSTPESDSPPGVVSGFLCWISSRLLPLHGGWTGLAKRCLACVWSRGTVMDLLGAGCFGFVFCLFVTVSS